MTFTGRKLTAGTAAVLFFGLFLALGTWQLQRRAWKLDLIDRVERRVHAPAVNVPVRSEWPLVKTASHEYRHVRATGVFLPASQTRVQALTELGSGFWLMTPLRLPDGSIVMVNRGFVAGEPGEQPRPADIDATGSQPAAAPRSLVTVTGLLRMSEPAGRFLRPNDASTDHWYSRDVQAIASARGLGPVAPYFIDADDSASAHADSPVGGLTVIAFHNNHLIYAITWYTLALMIPAALWVATRPLAAAATS